MTARSARSRLSAATFLSLVAAPVLAQEYCVACEGPAAVYRCVLDNATPQATPLKLLCAGTLARESGHATCSVRDGTVFDCNGPIRRVDAKVAGPILARPPAASPAASGAAATVTPAPASPPATAAKPTPQPRPDETPRTVEELARQMKTTSDQSLEKAGSAIGKAWTCVASLFKTC